MRQGHDLSLAVKKLRLSRERFKLNGTGSIAKAQILNKIQLSALLILSTFHALHFTSGFRLTADDVMYHDIVMRGVDNSLDFTQGWAVAQGRIGHFLAVPLQLIGGYLSENYAFRIFAVALHFLALLAFAKYAEALTGRKISIILFVLMISIQPLDFFHLPPNSYPLAISVPLLLVLSYRIKVLSSKNGGTQKTFERHLFLLAGLTGVLFGELMFSFFVTLVFLEIGFRVGKNKLSATNLTKLASEYRSEMFVILVFLITYFGFRFFIPSTYDGNSLGGRLGFEVIVGHIFGGTVFSALIRNEGSFLQYLLTFSVAQIVLLVLVFVLTLTLFAAQLKSMYFSDSSKAKLFFSLRMAVLGLVGAIILSVPIALTDKYQSWCTSLETCVYLDSRISFLFLSFSILGFLLIIADMLVARNLLSFFALVSFAGAIALVSALTYVNNSFMSSVMNKYVEPWAVAKSVSCLNFKEYPGLSLRSVINPGQKLSVHPFPELFDEEAYWSRIVSGYTNDPSLCNNVNPENLSNLLGRYNAPISERVELSNSQFPSFLLGVEGLSQSESWGRWSDLNLAPRVTFWFLSDLPSDFNFELVVRGYGSNLGGQMRVLVGDNEYEVEIPLEPSAVNLEVKGSENTRIISIEVPNHTRPIDVGGGIDYRKLGIAIYSMKITEK
jgi:hypothetical protein